jgi:hypothetical protein
MTVALFAFVCEVLAVTHYQRQRMVESIDRVRKYHQFPNFNDGDCLFPFKNQYMLNYHFNTNLYFFSDIQSTKMPTTSPSTNTDATEDGLTKPVKKKVQMGRLPTTRSHNHPNWNASRPNKHDVEPLLADYASAKTSKTAASLLTNSLGCNKNKSKTKKKGKAPDVDSVTMSAYTKGAAGPLMDDAVVGLVTASGDTNCKIIAAASAPTLYLTIEAAATKNNTAASSATDGGGVDVTRSTTNIRALSPPPDDGALEVLSRSVGTSTNINPEASPSMDDRAVVEGATPTDTTAKINAAASSARDGGGVDVTKSTKNIGAPSPPHDDGAMEALPRPVGTSKKINVATDEKN